MPGGSVSPDVHRRLLEVVRVTPPLFSKGRRMALPFRPPADQSENLAGSLRSEVLV